MDGKPGPNGRRHGLLNQERAEAPARRAASFTARRSTAVIADGTQIEHPGRLRRETPTR